jgi:hypothetical protein
MGWARLDDHFHGNPKVLETDLAALGLYALGLSYCNDHLTDGYLSHAAVVSLHPAGPWKAATRELVRAGLWEVVEGGHLVHDYLHWNDSRELVLAQRDYDKLRKTGTPRDSHEMTSVIERRDTARRALEGLRAGGDGVAGYRFTRPPYGQRVVTVTGHIRPEGTT